MTPGRISAFFANMVRSLSRRAIAALGRFPVAALALVALCIVANLEHLRSALFEADMLARVAAALFAGALANVWGRLIGESRGRTDLGAGLLAAAGGVAAALLVYAAPAISLSAVPCVAALALGLTLAPYLERGDSLRFWTFTLGAVVGGTVGFLAVILFVSGVWAILAMVETLFGFGLPSGAFDHIFITAFTFVGPLFALGRIPTRFDETVRPGEGERLPAALSALVDYVAAPLLLVTALVLHAYGLRILATGELPANQIGWIVPSFCATVLLVRVGAHPFFDEGAVGATRVLRRVWSFMLVLPLGLLAYALALRIGMEGLTAQRYYGVLGACAVALVLLMQAMPRLAGDIRLMVGLPLALLALSSAGPLGYAASVGRSQALRVEALLTARETNPPAAWRAEMGSRLRSLEDVDGLDRLIPVLDPATRAAFEAAPRGSEVEVLVTRLGAGEAPPEVRRVLTDTQTSSLDLDGYDRVVPALDLKPGMPIRIPGQGPDGASLTMAIDRADIVLTSASREERFALAAALADAPAGEHPAGALTRDLRSPSGRRIRLAVQRYEGAGRPERILSLSATLLYRSADWRVR
ncbi:DUF4153 domain-containing protein [Aurantimonas sp. Leaf443]|uniref:DUF4153 domain-containing protein n=1 Tax=Aurantimonas sp. Leaf443 TaxID=1736378 RepID=UPI0006FEB0DB|nr:DUF4153 domain-containing protein [Aurantimonas sp. Leaf443]KQT82561.1 hypothetical protein ASG48_15975 [Aurantimonas sp. Leaf443]